MFTKYILLSLPEGICAKYGSEPDVVYFETPLVVDNALGQIIDDGE